MTKKLSFHQAAKKVLQDNDFLHYKDITKVAIERWYIESDWWTPENTMNSHIWTLDRKDKKKNNFIKVWSWIYALKKSTEKDNLLVFLKYRLWNENTWLVNKTDKKILNDIFWFDIFENNQAKLKELLEKLKKYKKIEKYNILSSDIIEVLLLKDEKELPKDLEKQLKILKEEANSIKKLSSSVSNDSWIKELWERVNQINNQFRNALAHLPNQSINLWTENIFQDLEKISDNFDGILNNNPLIKDLSAIFSWLEKTINTFDLSKLTEKQRNDQEKLLNQIKIINKILVNPEGLFQDFEKKSYWTTLPTKLPTKLWKKRIDHVFEWYYFEWDFKTIRWFANISEISNISKAIYFESGWVQRNEDKKRCEKIKNYLENASQRFLPEVVLWLYITDDWAIKIENSIKWEKRKNLTWLSNNIKSIKIDLGSLKDGAITRIDWNHRLFYWNDIKNDFKIPFCFVIFDQIWENKELEKTHKNQEANIFYLLNWKNKPVSSEEALQVLLNMPDEEANNLYQDDSTLWLTKLCKEKYENYLKTNKNDAKRNFWDKVYTKFEYLVKYIEDLWIEKSRIDWTLDKIFSSINHLEDKYNKIIARDDFFYLVLNVVLDNTDKWSPDLNNIIKEFFNWILKEWLEDLSSTKQPILWELYKKEKSFNETWDIHTYQIDENKYYWKEEKGTAYKEFISILKESRKKIILNDIEEKRIWLEKIVDAYSKLLDIISNWWTDNAQRVEKIIQRFFYNSNKENMKKYLKEDFYDNLWKRVMNNDFAIRHHEIDKEKLEDKQFIEFLYSEYDNAIKFILDKAWLLIK